VSFRLSSRLKVTSQKAKQISVPLGEGLDESAATADPGGRPRGGGLSYRRVTHQFFPNTHTMSDRQTTHLQRTYKPRHALFEPLGYPSDPVILGPRITLPP